MYCSKCGKQQRDDAIFCIACGFKLSNVRMVNGPERGNPRVDSLSSTQTKAVSASQVIKEANNGKWYNMSKQMAIDNSLKIGQNISLELPPEAIDLVFNKH